MQASKSSVPPLFRLRLVISSVQMIPAQNSFREIVDRHAAATTPVQQLGVLLAHLTRPYQPSPEGLPGRPAHRLLRLLPAGANRRVGLAPTGKRRLVNGAH